MWDLHPFSLSSNLLPPSPLLCRHLLFLKQYDQVEELALNFTVVNNDLGEAQVGHAPHAIHTDSAW